MLKPLQTAENVTCQPPRKNNFKGMDFMRKNASMSARLQAAEWKYGLACLWAATTELENVRLRRELANTAAQAHYCRACM